MDLFSISSEQERSKLAPLAERMRPVSLKEFFGQDMAVGPNSFLRAMIEEDRIPSIILHGPPGSGKTTLAHIIAHSTQSIFEKLNAVTSGVADIRKIVTAAKENWKLYQRKTIVFIDEIHRFNKSQQDALLPYVEEGTIILIGATTENPFFEVNPPLLSRTRLIALKTLEMTGIVQILKRALEDTERGIGKFQIQAKDSLLEQIADIANGDARVALNLLEQMTMIACQRNRELTFEILEQIAGDKIVRYDKKGDNHYDVISAFIKSMRGSDPDAALHYLARMLTAGEDIKFIARRIAICAAEDVGNADPQALILAMAAAQAVQFVGMPEARIPLAQAVTYIACAPKSNAAYIAIDQALNDVKKRNCGVVPSYLCDSHTRQQQNRNYLYPHDYPNAWVQQTYLPQELEKTSYYRPTERGKEKQFYEWMNSKKSFDK